jgi:pimeloyl-ACP methyl ester carboxylesterase
MARHARPEWIDVPVTGGDLRVARWGAGPNIALAAHGITGSSMSWAVVGRHLPGDWTLLVPDLRGRGESRGLPEPFGIKAHVTDLLAVADHAGAERAVVAGHSMGAYVAALTAATTPALTERLVLIDGGLPLPAAPEGMDADDVLEATIGPALTRLQMTFAGPDEYADFWRAHPAFAEWNDDVDAYVRYDLAGEPGVMRSKASEAAVRADGRDLFLDQATAAEALRTLRCPTTLVRARRGLFDEPGGFQPDALVDAWIPEIDDFTVVTVDANHYSIMLGDRGAAAVAGAISGEGPVTAG